MNNAHFIWADLATYESDRASKFYSEVFNWQMETDADGYSVASASGVPVAGVYPMPDEYRKLKMPAFWMSYVGVEDVATSAAKAVKLGAKVEYEGELEGYGRFALVRDPLGAGFTICEQSEDQRIAPEDSVQIAWNELHVSDAAVASRFYSALFGWELKKEAEGRLLIHTAGYDEPIGAIQQLSDADRGGFEYWAVFFLVADRKDIEKQIQSRGGKLLYSDDDCTMVSDPADGHFFLIEHSAN